MLRLTASERQCSTRSISSVNAGKQCEGRDEHGGHGIARELRGSAGDVFSCIGTGNGGRENQFPCAYERAERQQTTCIESLMFVQGEDRRVDAYRNCIGVCLSGRRAKRFGEELPLVIAGRMLVV